MSLGLWLEALLKVSGVMINWLLNKMIVHLQRSEGTVNIYRRLDKLDADSHPPIFQKTQLHKIHKRLEDLETKSFVDKVNKYGWEGSD